MTDEVKSFRCRVCNVAVPYSNEVHKKMRELELCFTHWKNMI